MERDNARMEELLAMMARPRLLRERGCLLRRHRRAHAKLKQRLAAAGRSGSPSPESWKPKWPANRAGRGSLRFEAAGYRSVARTVLARRKCPQAFPFAAELAW